MGEQFARLEATLVLATTLQRYHLELTPETALGVEAAVTTRPGRPDRVDVHKREAPAPDGERPTGAG